MSDHIKSNTPSSSTRGGAVPVTASSINTSTRQLALERELGQLNRINSTMASLIQTIKFTNDNISKLNDASESTHTLLDQWIRILSQTNFTHDVINDKVWKGVTAKDDRVEDGEDEEEDEDEAEEEEDDFEEKLQLEQELLKQFQSLESENEKLERRLDTKDYDRNSQSYRDNESTNKRRKELGLLPIGTNPRYRAAAVPGSASKRVRSGR